MNQFRTKIDSSLRVIKNGFEKPLFSLDRIVGLQMKDVHCFCCFFGFTSLLSSPLLNDNDLSEDHLAFLQEPMSDEEDELDIENSQNETGKSDLPEEQGSSQYGEKGKHHEIGNCSMFLHTDP